MTVQKLRRARYVRIRLEDKQVFDIGRLLGGDLKIEFDGAAPVAFSALTGRHLELEDDDLGLLRAVPGDRWLDVHSLIGDGEKSLDELRPRIDKLASAGLLLLGEGSEDAGELSRRQEKITALGWPEEAFLFHRLNLEKETRSRQQDGTRTYRSELENLEETAAAFVKKRGLPPPPTFSVGSRGSVELGPPRRGGAFFDALTRRKSSRFFDRSRALGREALETLLYYAFGALGEYRLNDDYILFHKVSPSGGGLHPIEAFPLALKVADLEPGFYHYNCRYHRLDRVRDVAEDEARSRILSGAQHQEYLADAALVVVLAARVGRNFWKYKGRDNTYNVMMMDAGHLSQTFYLTAAALELGALYTAAVRQLEILDALGLDPDAFIVLGLCACGELEDGAEEIPLKTIPLKTRDR